MSPVHATEFLEFVIYFWPVAFSDQYTIGNRWSDSRTWSCWAIRGPAAQCDHLRVSTSVRRSYSWSRTARHRCDELITQDEMRSIGHVLCTICRIYLARFDNSNDGLMWGTPSSGMEWHFSGCQNPFGLSVKSFSSYAHLRQQVFMKNNIILKGELLFELWSWSWPILLDITRYPDLTCNSLIVSILDT